MQADAPVRSPLSIATAVSRSRSNLGGRGRTPRGRPDRYAARVLLGAKCQGIDAAAVPLSFFAGTWDLFNGGGGAWMKSTKRDWHVGTLDAAHAPPITLTADGRYTWVLDSKTTIRGQWRAAQKSELKDGYEKLGTAILLLNGESDKNWLVTRQLVGTDDGRDRILIERVDLGLTYRGGRVK
jgi:hypothetical protein